MSQPEFPMTEEKPPAADALAAKPHGRWLGKFRVAVLAVFAVLTVYAGYLLVVNDWQDIAGFWLTRRRLLLAGFLLSMCDICTDCFIWTRILRQHGIRLGFRRSVSLFLTGYAGQLMPVQLGRFFRATELSRMYGVSLAMSTKAELTLLGFVVLSSVSMFLGALVFSWSPLPGILLPVLLIPAGLFVAEWVVPRIPRMPIQWEPGYWRRPSTIVLGLLSSFGWLYNGTILFLIFREVAGALHLHQTVMIVTSNLFVGVCTGLPGGLGITETYIGAMMYWLSTPPEHLVIAVAAFRIITFWSWIPVGWVAVLLNSFFFGGSRTVGKPERDESCLTGQVPEP